MQGGAVSSCPEFFDARNHLRELVGPGASFIDALTHPFTQVVSDIGNGIKPLPGAPGTAPQ